MDNNVSELSVLYEQAVENQVNISIDMFKCFVVIFKRKPKDYGTLLDKVLTEQVYSDKVKGIDAGLVNEVLYLFTKNQIPEKSSEFFKYLGKNMNIVNDITKNYAYK